MGYTFSGFQIKSLCEMINKFNSLCDNKYGNVKEATLGYPSLNSLSNALDSQDDEYMEDVVMEDGGERFFNWIFSYTDNVSECHKDLQEYFYFIEEFGGDRNKAKLDSLYTQFNEFKESSVNTQDEFYGYDEENKPFMYFINQLQATALEVFFYDMCCPAWFEAVAFHGLGDFLEKVLDTELLNLEDLCESELFDTYRRIK